MLLSNINIFPENLLENGSLRPKNGWNGNICKDIEFSPWEVLENGGDGIQLEKSPSGRWNAV